MIFSISVEGYKSTILHFKVLHVHIWPFNSFFALFSNVVIMPHFRATIFLDNIELLSHLGDLILKLFAPVTFELELFR